MQNWPIYLCTKFGGANCYKTAVSSRVTRLLVKSSFAPSKILRKNIQMDFTQTLLMTVSVLFYSLLKDQSHEYDMREGGAVTPSYIGLVYLNSSSMRLLNDQTKVC